VALTSLALLTVAAIADGGTAAAWLLGAAASAVAVGMVREAGGALAACHDAMGSLADASEEHDHVTRIPARGSHA
jgi:hypothetical protein